jgi:hypothetical protein
MDNQFTTLGYGFHLDETVLMLESAVESSEQQSVKDYCLANWQQKSMPNKVRMWNHLSKRFFDIEAGRIVQTPFLQMYGKIKNSTRDSLDLIFFQLCRRTPLVFQTLKSLASGSFLNTGEAVFSKYHLDQLLENIFGHVPQSTCERVRQILIKAGRLTLSNSNYSASAYCPSESILGFALYHDAELNGWRAPSTNTVMDQGTIAATFLCNRPLLIAGVNRLAAKGYCEYHRHGNTDQIQLTHQALEDFVNAWK